ncbi:hypothetical protein ACH6CV_15940 [Bacillota bacterium Meth-B3]
MANNVYPVLCGGTYFTLILEARKQRTSQRSRYNGEQDGLSQTDTLAGLGRVVYPEYIPPVNRQTFRTNANAYKSCADDGSNLSFLLPDRVAAFDKRVRTEYPQALKAMCIFTEQFLEVGTSINREEWLLKALLDLIETDPSIDDNQEFFICSDGQGVTKATLRRMSDFALQPLLLGVWHYAVVHRKDNKSGKSTFDAWCPSRDRAERKYEGNMGDGIERQVHVEAIKPPADGIIAKKELTASTETMPPFVDTDPKRVTVNNYGTVQNQKFISIETMNGDIHL